MREWVEGLFFQEGNQSVFCNYKHKAPKFALRVISHVVLVLASPTVLQPVLCALPSVTVQRTHGALLVDKMT